MDIVDMVLFLVYLERLGLQDLARLLRKKISEKSEQIFIDCMEDYTQLYSCYKIEKEKGE